MRRLLPAILLLVSLPLASAAPPTTQDQVSALITKLSDDNYQTREDATQKLIRLGDAALPRLRQLLPLTVDGEARNRIQTAVDQIVESAVSGESLLTLDFKDADPKDVFAEISRQCHAQVGATPETLAGLPKVTLHCDHEPFWPVLRRLCAPLELQPDVLRIFGGGMVFSHRSPQLDHSINLVRAKGIWDKTPTSFSGPFMICVQRITQTGMVIPATDQRSHNLMVECLVIPEPKLTIVGRNATALVSVPDPQGANPAGIPGMGNFRAPFSSRVYYNPTGGNVWPLLVPVNLPPGVTGKLPQLKATSTARLLVRSENWEIDNIGSVAPRSWTSGGRTYSIKSLSWQGDAVELIASVSRKTDGSIDADDLSVFNSLELFDPSHRSLPVRSRSQRPGTDLTFSMTFDSTPAGAPVQHGKFPLHMKWTLPLDTRDTELKLDFTDLPLP